MRRFVSALLICAFLLALPGCGGNVHNARILDYSSEIYTDREVDDAIEVAIDYFIKEFSGCTLTEITYIGDDSLSDYQEFADRSGADDVIVLVSTFNVGESGGDGSLNPNSTYEDWKWILVRSDGGKWRHLDHGY